MGLTSAIHKGDFKHHLFALRQLAKREREHSNAASALGQLWQIIDPLIVTLVMVLIFSDMLGNSKFANFPIYILSGNIIYSLFNEGTTRCLSSLSSNKNFLIKAQLPRQLYVYERVYVAFINFLYSFGIFLVFFLITGEKIKWTFLCMIPNLVLLLMLITGMGKILAVINVVFADITYFYKIFTLLIFYGSALFYSTTRLAPSAQFVLSLNPVYLSIAIARQSMIDGIVPKWTVWLKLLVYAVFAYVVGTRVFNKGSEDVVAKL